MKLLTKFSLLLLLFPLLSHAAETDNQQPISLSADNVELDNSKGISIYRGNVVMQQGTLELKGDKLTVYTNSKSQVEKVLVEGQPASYQQIPEGKTDPVTASAQRMEYLYGETEVLTLLEQASMQQRKDTFTGERIVYNVTLDKLQADSVNNPDSRVTVTLHPKEKDNE